jgi:hypothetical protein
MPDEVPTDRVELLNDLKLLRRRRNYVDPTKTPRLRRVALAGGGTASEFVKVHECLKEAAGQLPAPTGDALLAILGVTTFGATAPERREIAARLLETTPYSLERNSEEDLIATLVDQLLALETIRSASSSSESEPRPVEREDPEADGSEVAAGPGPAARGGRTGSDSLPNSPIATFEPIPPVGDELPQHDCPEVPDPTDQLTGTTDLADPSAKTPSGTTRRILPGRTLRLAVPLGAAMVIALVATLAASGNWPFGTGAPSSSTHIPQPNAKVAATCPTPRAGTGTLPVNQASAPVTVRLLAQASTSRTWDAYLAPVMPAATVRYLLEYRNGSRTDQDQVILRTNLAPDTLLRPDSTCLYDESNPEGLLVVSNDVSQGGLNVGNFGPGATAYLMYSLAMPPTGDIACGNTTITTVGVAHPHGMNEFENSAQVNVGKSC